MKKTYHGSCHCGAVRFRCDIDLSQGTSRCNCSICRKTRFWKSIIPATDFRLLEGEEMLSDYQFGEGRVHHRFCKCCGVKPFGNAEFEGLGEVCAINIACLDDLPESDLEQSPLSFQDGASGDWEHPPKNTRWL